MKDSVVIIKSLDAKGEETAMGSGVLLPSGKIATNCHVIKDGTSFQVGRGKRFVVATVYAGDDDKDICLLDAKDIGGKPATLGKAASLKIGEAVYAVGAPQGLELSLSDGIVSQLRGGTPPLIQTTAAISPGSSGGGLFDSEARLVGFTTLYIDGGQSLNFAMPVEWLAEIKPGKKIASTQRSQIDWLTRAAALEEKKDWPGLLAWGKQWVKAEPENAAAWFSIGYAHRELNQSEQAVAVYRQALRIDPEYAMAWYNLGNTYNNLKRYDDAIAAYRQALRIDPERQSWYNMGVTYYTLKRYDDAIAAYRQALRIDPEHASVWYNLGVTYADLKRYDDAIAAYRQALRIDPEHASTWYNLGGTYGSLKRYDDAIAAYRQALHFSPEYASAWYNLAVAYELSGNTTAALQAVKTLRKLDPTQAEKLFNLIVPR
ncbi:MAG: tetratricopeptide repeat-containing serine protease family protein [Thiobacillus sp.]|nr:tetratricopeptide repeat-containing serine protease family protein [Thiobacillus sp.]